MIKRRESTRLSTEQDFINGSELIHLPTEKNIAEVELDPRAPRKFKSHTLPLNEYEYKLLCDLAEKYGQTHSGIIRFALKALGEHQ